MSSNKPDFRPLLLRLLGLLALFTLCFFAGRKAAMYTEETISPVSYTHLGIIEAFEHGCQSRYEMAEYLEVTEEFLEGCVSCYRNKYGVGTTLDNYYITFIPNLNVGRIDFSM